jgi:hypothetical protein
MADGVRVLASAAVAAVAAVLLIACADQQKARELDLAELLGLIAGHYDNAAQVEADARRGLHPPHDALALDIVPVDDPLIGEHVFYVQEMAADDARRVMVQRVWTIDVVDKNIVQTVWTLKEPLRFRDAQHDPDLLKSMMNQDVVKVRGCNLTWKKLGEKFTAGNDPKTCRSTSRVTGGTVQIDTRMELDANGFSLAENATDAAGQLVQGRTDEPFVRFRRASQ